MSLSTTRDRVGTVLESVTGVGSNVGRIHNRIRNDLDRPDAEAHLIGATNILNCWEYQVVPAAAHGGASGMNRATAHVTIRAHYKADDANGSFNAFCDLIEAVCLALLNPTSGFPQIDEGGVQVTERPSVPVKVRTDHSAYRAQIEFDLWDVLNT